MAHPQQQSPLAIFDRVRIINLAHRQDRKRQVIAELAGLQEQVDGARVSFFPAVRPTTAEGFESIGARGCFISHLEILRAAVRENVSSLLILEDDVAFSTTEATLMPSAIAALNGTNWDVFYGGSPARLTGQPLSKVPAEEGLLLTHFIALNKSAIRRLVPYLEAMLTRPAGSPAGGPMHVDAAYSNFRKFNPDIVAFAATPHIAHQRASATDIHVHRGLQAIPILRYCLVPLRAIKNRIQALK